MKNTILFIIAAICLCFMLFYIGRILFTNIIVRFSNTKKDLDYFYNVYCPHFKNQHTLLIVKQFSLNEQIALVHAYKNYLSLDNTHTISPGAKAMNKIANNIHTIDNHDEQNINWNEGVINAFLQVRFAEIQKEGKNIKKYQSRTIDNNNFHFSDDEQLSRQIRIEMCHLIDDLFITPLPFGPAYIFKQKVTCKVYPHYDINSLVIIDRLYSRLKKIF